MPVTDEEIEVGADALGSMVAKIVIAAVSPGSVFAKVSTMIAILMAGMQVVQPLLDAGANPLRLATEATVEIGDELLDGIPANVDEPASSE